MKLKTLKDLDVHSWEGEACYLKKELKAEAVKWVKAMQKEKPHNWYDKCEMMCDFHNITEEDLK